MKTTFVRLIRVALPVPLQHVAETVYRMLRIFFVSLRFGFPARRLKIIAITGTNGKTTTASFINAILKKAGKKTAMFSTAQIEIGGKTQPNTLNATIGTTVTMQRFFARAKRQRVDYVIIEATSHAIDQHKLDFVPVEVAVMTNLTQDHLDYHQTMDGYARAKARLFQKQPNFIVLNQDDEWYDFFNKFTAQTKKITYGKTSSADVRLVSQQPPNATVSQSGESISLTVHLPGQYNLYNALAATAIASLLDIGSDAVIDGINSVKAIPGRFEYVDIHKPYEVIVDYAHTPDALENLLGAVRELTSGKVLLVFGACGDRDKLKRPIMGEIAVRLADTIFLTDEESYNESPQAIRDQIRQGIDASGGAAKTTEISDRKAAIDAAMQNAVSGDIVVITGMGHEEFRIVQGKQIPWNDTKIVEKIALN